MNIEERNRIIDRIKKCLALGDVDKNPSEEEADTAVKMAQKLMSDYNVTMADIAFSEENFGKIREEGISINYNVGQWETQLSGVVNNLFNTKCVRSRRFDGCSLIFYGFDDDVALSIEVYKMLKLEIIALSKRVPFNKRAYCLGVVHTLYQRTLKKEEISPESQSKVNALVVVKNNEISKWEKEHFPHLRRRSAPRFAGSESYYAGKRDGANVGLSFRSTVKNKSNTLLLGGR